MRNGESGAGVQRMASAPAQSTDEWVSFDVKQKARNALAFI